jgi:nicotinate phosphoribosyltransferase
VNNQEGPPTPPAAGSPGATTPSGPSTALLTDQYELTMLDAALRSGMADHPAVFEVFTRRLPAGRLYGVVAGVGRLLDAFSRFEFGDEELEWLERQAIVGPVALDWLRDQRFSGHVDAYREGELYTANSPVVTVEATFGEAVLLETLVLSILNHDSAVAAAAALIVSAAGQRPVIEMGSRRTDPGAAVAAARAAYLAGFASTSNLEAGRRYGIPTAGTAAHAFTLAYGNERKAFAAQVASLGAETTLLVDTYDTEEGIRDAVAVAGPGLGAVRIDSGDLVSEAWRARRLLDELGATGTRVVVTGDLDHHTLRELADAPADSYGVGTNVVTGLGSPTAGFVYKLVAVGDTPGGELRPVAKRSPGKSTVGGRKWAWRVHEPRPPDGFDGPSPRYDRPVWADLIAGDPEPPSHAERALQQRVVDQGRIVGRVDLAEARRFHRTVHAELPAGEPLISYRRPLR